MADITADLIKQLRQRTGVGMTKCKEALVEAKGDMEAAIDVLRKKGMASAVKKEGREANEGKISAAETDKAIAIVEVNSETDFVAQNEKFVKFAGEIAQQAAESTPKTLEAFMQAPTSSDSTMTIDQYRNLIIQTFGENIKIKRLEIINKKDNASYGIYSHMGGKIVVIVELEDEGAGRKDIAREVAMHIAAESPDYVSSDQVPQEVKEREEQIAKAQVTGKPEHIIDKIVEGKMKAYFDQICLLGQKFVKDSSFTVQEYVDKCGKEDGKTFKITKFWRWTVG
jgi:elongation factor Ts